MYNQHYVNNDDWIVYEGEFVSNKKMGVGKMTFASNDIYFG